MFVSATLAKTTFNYLCIILSKILGEDAGNVHVIPQAAQTLYKSAVGIDLNLRRQCMSIHTKYVPNAIFLKILNKDDLPCVSYCKF